VRVFAGYSGWGPGQLEDEIGEDAWLSVPAQPDDVFGDEPELLWERAVGRLGPAYRMLRTMPFDPSAN
jgi:putative transcriptional regulator